MPHHDHEVEVFDARTGTYLGSAGLADQASAEQVKAVRRARQSRRDRLSAELRRAEKARRQRYAAVTTAEPARPLGAMTRDEATAELVDAGDAALRSQARPRVVPLGPPEPGWVLPRSAQQRPADAAGISSGSEEKDTPAP